jgi:hypothetical protein
MCMHLCDVCDVIGRPVGMETVDIYIVIIGRLSHRAQAAALEGAGRAAALGKLKSRFWLVLLIIVCFVMFAKIHYIYVNLRISRFTMCANYIVRVLCYLI